MSSTSNRSPHPFASPNAIPPRTSSTGILNLNAPTINPRGSVLRPLKEDDWIGQSKKTKTSHSVDGLNKKIHHRSKSHIIERRPFSTASTICPQPAMTNQQHAPGHPSLGGPNLYSTPLSPPSEQTKDLGEDLIYGNGVAWTSEKERILLGPYDYLYGHPGKDIRSQCIAAFNLWLKIPPQRLEVITRVVGMLHTASLL